MKQGMCNMHPVIIRATMGSESYVRQGGMCPMDYRIEKDSLGQMQVPGDALYGAQTQRAVLNFPISGMRPYPAFVWAMAVIKRAAAEVNLALGLLDQRLAAAIVEAAQEVIDGKLRDQFVVDPFQ